MNNLISTLKKAFFLKWFVLFFLAICSSLLLPHSLIAATMDDYCLIPAFVLKGGMKSNLILMIDNSGSMYDLQYIDEGRQDSAGVFTREPTYCYDQTYKSMACSNDRTQGCTVDANCAGGGTCEKNVYGGYFDYGRCSATTSSTCVEDSDCPSAETCNEVIYKYDSADERFEPGAAFPVPCTNEVSGTLCVNIVAGTPPTVNAFVANGNYLNWLASSKFDVEKQVLTGGKYDTDTNELLAETRGCVGRRFVKEANTADFVNYDSPEPDPSPNTSLGVTFGVKCETISGNVTSICYGGQTLIEIFKGDFDPSECQEAIDLLEAEAQKQKITDAIAGCLDITASNKRFCQFDTRDPKPACNGDSNCIIESGTCDITNNGVCGVDTPGTCSVTSLGTCTANNGVCGAKRCFGGARDGLACNNLGQCPGGTSCSKACDGGGKAGSICNNDNDCKISSCTAGNVGAVCTVNANCDVKNCTAGDVGDSCVVNQDCDLKSCTAPATRVGDSCAVNADCNSSACVEPGPDALIGNLCSENWDCSDTYGRCLAPATTQLASTFTQSMHTCYQYIINDADLGPEDVNIVSNPAGCNQIYAKYKTCFGGANDGSVCSGDADCGAGTCENGPDYIYPGNPAYLCSTSYAGYCAEMSAPDWAGTTWVAREYLSSDECILAKFREYCGGLDLPPVIDPTDDPSDTSSFANLPAILADIGAEAQLGQPIAEFPVRVDRTANPDPQGLLQEFSNRIRFGAMSFNFNGTATECEVPTEDEPTPTIPCPKTCSSNRSLACIVASDCPVTLAVPNPTCDATVPDTDNLDGGKIIHYIGTPWRCRINTGTSCSEDFQCPDFETGETCNTVGNHVKGTCSSSADSCSYDYECPGFVASDPDSNHCVRTLIHTIDSIRGDAWTPFSEAFLSAIGYYAKETAEAHNPNPLVYGTSRTSDGIINLQLNNPAKFSYETDKNPSQYRCQTNNLLLISDGMSTADANPNVGSAVSSYNDGDGLTGSGVGGCPKYSGTRNLDDLAWLGQHREITDFTQPVTIATDQYKKIQTYTIYNGATSNDPDECNPDTLLRETADNGGGKYARTEGPEELKRAIAETFTRLAGGSSSGTAASVLASGQDKGANLLQAIFYPKRPFGTADDPVELDWSGTLQNLWYYISPRFKSSSIREDTDQNNVLHLKNDYVARYYFDEADTLTTRVRLYWDQDGDYSNVAEVDDVPVEKLKNLWEVGKVLWERDISADTRNIKTYIGNDLISFSKANRKVLKPYLQAADDTESEAIIRYISGEDTPFDPVIPPDGDGVPDFAGTYRNRTVGIDLNDDGDITDPGEEPKVWKLGDIINSTPQVVSWIPINSYDLKYNDNSYKQFTVSTDYKNRGIVFTGANDGMLHAAKLGLLQLKNNPANDPVWSAAAFEEARIINPNTEVPAVDSKSLGSEIWAFIPKHVLPYLKYIAEDGYCHLYYVDGVPHLVDASIGGAAGVQRPADGTSWRTVIIGSMRLGGACRKADAVCTNCVKAPGVDLNGDGDKIDIVNGNDESRLGMSSYFAIDITDKDPENWKLLWEFSDENIPAAELADGGLGFSTGGQAVVRINPAACLDAEGDTQNDCNGEWFVVIPSGPTGPIDTSTKQFMGRSDQKLKVFVIDLRTGAFQTAIKNFNGSPINFAFGGAAKGSSTDPDLDYQDDALYLGYTKSADGVGDTFTEGGVVRILTQEDPNPVNWVGSKLIENIGPVTAAVDRMQNTKTHKLWLYFGTGRYFFKQVGIVDDAAGARAIYGAKDPCFNYTASVAANPDETFDPACSTTLSEGDLDDATDAPDMVSDDIDNGWLINLDEQNVPEAGFDAERSTSTPTASTIGAVFFSTFKPSRDVCNHGGKSRLWAVMADTGGTATSVLRGRALMQLSTGSIKEIDLKEAFKDHPETYDRTSDFDPGMKDEGKVETSTLPPATEKVIHMREK